MLPIIGNSEDGLGQLVTDPRFGDVPLENDISQAWSNPPQLLFASVFSLLPTKSPPDSSCAFVSCIPRSCLPSVRPTRPQKISTKELSFHAQWRKEKEKTRCRPPLYGELTILLEDKDCALKMLMDSEFLKSYPVLSRFDASPQHHHPRPQGSPRSQDAFCILGPHRCRIRCHRVRRHPRRCLHVLLRPSLAAFRRLLRRHHHRSILGLSQSCHQRRGREPELLPQRRV
jgi:hypothetical protein